MTKPPTTPIQTTPMAIFSESSLAAEEFDGFGATGSTGTDCPLVHDGPVGLIAGLEDVGLVAHRVHHSFACSLDYWGQTLAGYGCRRAANGGPRSALVGTACFRAEILPHCSDLGDEVAKYP